VRTRRIPNALPVALAVFGLALGAFSGWRGLLSAFAAGSLLLVLGTIPFGLGLLGGGDVKLLAGTATVFGLSGALPLAVYTALMGGVLALAVAAATGELRSVAGRAMRVVAPQLAQGPAPPASARRLPYAVAIAAAVLWMLLAETVLPALKLVR